MKRSKSAKLSRSKIVAGQETMERMGSEDSRVRFYLMERLSTARNVAWDPWPVKRFRQTEVSRAAKELVDLRNVSSLNHSIDKIVLLPASGNVPGIQGGTANMNMYSLRSPGLLPRRIHLWKIPGGKVMTRVGIESKPFVEFLKGLGVTDSRDSAKHLYFWKALSVSEKNPEQLVFPKSFEDKINIPEKFQSEMYQRWRAITVFPFLALPAEVPLSGLSI